MWKESTPSFKIKIPFLTTASALAKCLPKFVPKQTIYVKPGPIINIGNAGAIFSAHILKKSILFACTP